MFVSIVITTNQCKQKAVTIVIKLCKSNNNNCIHFFQARNKPVDGSTHVSKNLQAGQRTPTHGPKSAAGKTPAKPVQKQAAQKGQPIKQAPAKAAATANNKSMKKPKKGGKHHQHDLIVTIDLVSYYTIFNFN